MSQQVGLHLDAEHVDRLQELVDDGTAESASEAARVLLSRVDQLEQEVRRLEAESARLRGELREERQSETPSGLEGVANRLGDGLGIAGIVLLGAAYWFPLEIRLLVVGPLLGSLACYGIQRVLARSRTQSGSWLPWGEET